jgi:hypothetical protein
METVLTADPALSSKQEGSAQKRVKYLKHPVARFFCINATNATGSFTAFRSKRTSKNHTAQGYFPRAAKTELLNQAFSQSSLIFPFCSFFLFR